MNHCENKVLFAKTDKSIHFEISLYAIEVAEK